MRSSPPPGPPQARLRCACGWEVTGTRDDVLVAARDHGLRLHNMEATREQLLASIEEAEAGR